VAVSTSPLPHRSHEGSITRSAQRNSKNGPANTALAMSSAVYGDPRQENDPENEGHSAPVEMATLGDVRPNQVDHVPKGNPLTMRIELSEGRQSAKIALLWGSTEIRQNRLFYTTSLRTPVESRYGQSITDPHRSGCGPGQGLGSRQTQARPGAHDLCRKIASSQAPVRTLKTPFRDFSAVKAPISVINARNMINWPGEGGIWQFLTELSTFIQNVGDPRYQ
jgi:hypothetical protein